eukprot:CAMPEP_0205812842 /NCGR_PEP_ID=MMETSP0205-20121125/17464_1 /ASSEMBLY_ACC=CAM_ASM_000278 /TAXON_ID=36767 /ORGANISM="Euplotes focardii, Strain TN1" /LENGTH=99 /DNA_ID=CAMNT_0053094261 /DNA_START=517 /DNA_END=817 /DNA_ORIENTATION=-
MDITKADDEIIKAAAASAGYLKEIKIKSDREWGFFSLRHGLWGGITGALAGGLVGMAPGAIIGGTVGAAGGGYVAGKVQKDVKDNIGEIQEQKPEFIKE